MSTCLRSMPSLRAARTINSSAALAQQPVRSLHITGAKDSPSQLLKPAVASKPVIQKSKESRTFNTSRSLKQVGDSSTIDFAFLPDASALQPGMISTAAMNIPILPDTYRATTPASNTAFARSNAAEDIVAEVQTVSMSMPGQVAVLSEIDGATHEGREMDVFKLVENVSKSVVGSVKDAVQGVQSEVGVIQEVWDGMVGDLMSGARRAA